MNVQSLDDLDLRLRAAFVNNARLRYAVAYGSRTQAPGGVRQDDRFSDLEYFVYTADDSTVAPQDLIGSVTPVLLATRNSFGTPNFVTSELHRVELHVESADRLALLLGWSVWAPVPERMLVKDDAAGTLAGLLSRFAARPVWEPEAPQETLDGVLNALVAVRAFVRRGELLRANEWFALQVVGGLTRLARHAAGLPQPPAAGRRAELDLPDVWLGSLHRLPSLTHAPMEGLHDALDLCGLLSLHLGLDGRNGLASALRS